MNVSQKNSTPSPRLNRVKKTPSEHRKAHQRNYHLHNLNKAFRSWLVPYLKSRIYFREFRPVLSFLYTDLNCNLDCHYCYANKSMPGMTRQVAEDSVEWLKSRGCRVLAYMGGEPLLRKQFIIDLTRYAIQRGFFVYLPTNGLLLERDFIDEIGEAGVSTINLAVDAVEQREGLPKYFERIKSQFEYLVEQEHRYGYITFFNINITENNVEDVRRLTEIAHTYGIASDYHINEPPPIKYDYFKHEEDGGWIKEDKFQAVDQVIDWLIEKNREGYTMVNSIEHLQTMKQFIRHQLPAWPCQAGQLTMIIRLDGSFAPCFELYGDDEDWGNIYEGPKFDPRRLAERKVNCSPHCLSTCNFQGYHYTRSALYSIQWVVKHAYARFMGVS